MVILEQLRIHVGGLVRIKDELFWFGGRGWDGITGRVCLLLDAAPARSAHFVQATATATGEGVACALLLLDGAPRWVCAGANDLELL